MIATIGQAMERAGVTSSTLSGAQKAALDAEGYVVLRGVFDAELCARMTDAFERHYVPSHLSKPPRGHGSRHAMLNDEPVVCRACLSPVLLASAHHLLGRRFFLFDVQGRDPLPGYGDQRMHRDWTQPQGPAPMVIALAFLDPFGPENGATRLLPGSHRLAGGPDVFQDLPPDHPQQVTVAGEAGDVLMMDGYLAHAGTRNATSRTRRNLQIAYHAHELRAKYRETRNLTVYRPEERYLLGEEA